MPLLSIIASGMVTGVGLNAPASCAAIRCGVNASEETRFIDEGGEWIMGVRVPLSQPWRGRSKLVQMVVPAIQECLEPFPDLSIEHLPLLLCVAEEDRPGRLAGLDGTLLMEIQVEIGQKFHESSALIPKGKVGIVAALRQAEQVIDSENVGACIIAGVDSLLIAETLKAYEEEGRLLNSKNSDGFIPGEAGTAVLVTKTLKTMEPSLHCLGMGFGQEEATENSGQPLKAEGLMTAIREACTNANRDIGETDFRVTDLSGEQYYFKEAALALTRILRTRKEEYDIWHPADCVGEVGAAIGPAMLSVLLAAYRKGYSLGSTALAHFGNVDGARAAVVIQQNQGGNA